MADILNKQHGITERLEKLPWQMTKVEYEIKFGGPKANSTLTGNFSKHKSVVEIALNRGLPVPSDVLKDYPDLIHV